MNARKQLLTLISLIISGAVQLLAQGPGAGSLLNSLLPPIDPAKIPKDSLREIKTAGETYYAEGQLDIIGDVASDKLKGYFRKEAKNIHFTSRWALVERIESVDVDSGRVVSVIEIGQVSSQVIGGAHTRFDVALLKSEDVAKLIADNWGKITATADGLLESAGPIAGRLLSRTFEHWRGRKIEQLKAEGYRVEADGTIIIPATEVAKWRPELQEIVGAADRTPNVTGAQFHAVWEWGKGYTLVLTNNAGKRFDGEAIAAFKKAVERSSLLSSRLIFPARDHGRPLEPGSVWQVNAGALAGTLMSGFSYDRLEGVLQLRYLRNDVGNYPDERRNLGNRARDIGLVVLGVDSFARSPNNLVSGVFDNPRNEAERVSFRIKPQGNLTLVSDPEIPSRYIRKIELDADNLAEASQFEDSLLKGVKFTGKAKVKMQFLQHRVMGK